MKKFNIYLIIIWLLVYSAAPAITFYGWLSGQQAFNWHDVMLSWCSLTAFLVLFLLNHYLLMPYLLQKKRITAYVVSVILALTVFIAYFALTDKRVHRPGPPPMEYVKAKTTLKPNEKRPEPVRLPFAPQHMVRFVVALLMIGVDMGAMARFNERKMRDRLLQLEKQNLQQELQHLRYQINPHFFMNTLNNIHALIDIDPERAKRVVVKLSGLMRYALYEGNGSLVSLNHEVEFLKLYISLMKMRYNDKVEVVCHMPEQVPPEAMMPPMLLATFVENAFKHGISYLEPSFIHVNLSLENNGTQIHFQCVNSRHTATEDGHHGIGLENVRKRLNLQYAQDYILKINDTDENQFDVNLILPIKTQTT